MEKYRPQETQQILIDLEKYGYKNDDRRDELLAGRLQEILQKGPQAVTKEFLEIFGEESLKEEKGLKAPDHDDVIRMGISVDIARKIRPSFMPAGIIQYFARPNPWIIEENVLKNGILRDGIQKAEIHNLKLIHDIADQAATAIAEGYFT